MPANPPSMTSGGKTEKNLERRGKIVEYHQRKQERFCLQRSKMSVANNNFARSIDVGPQTRVAC